MDWLSGIFDSISAGLSNITVYLISIVGYLQAAIAYVWEVLQAIANWLLAAVQKIGAWLKNLWQGGFKGLFGRLLKLYKDVHTWLESHLKPIVDFIKNAQTWWDRYYKLHILPMINLIQKIRRYLLILRLLHVKFATTLDNYLLTIEQALNKVNLAIRGSLNMVIDWLNLATNPTGLGRLVLVSIASRRAVGAIVRAVTGLPLGHFFPYNGPGSFAFERQPMTSADYTDPLKNPPPSLILAPLLQFMAPAELDPNQVVSDVDIDAGESLPWGGTFIANVLRQDDYYSNLEGDELSLYVALETNTGMLWKAGTESAAYLSSILSG